MLNKYSINNLKDNSLSGDDAEQVVQLVQNMVFIEKGVITIDTKDVITAWGNLHRKANPKTIKIENDFYIGKYPVTREEWIAIMGNENDPSKYKVIDNYLPVYNVTNEDCMRFIIKLNRITGLNFSLPTSDQWDYAAHGGNEGTYDFQGKNLKEIYKLAWFENHEPMPVGVKQPNPLGLYDVFGNVGELCIEDDYGDVVKGGNIVSLKVDDSPWTYHYENYWTENDREKRYGYVKKLYHGLRLVLNID